MNPVAAEFGADQFAWFEENLCALAPVARGSQAAIYQIAVSNDDGSRNLLALKRFYPENPKNSADSVLREWSALTAFGDALSKASIPVSTPVPIRVFPDRLCYVMSYVEGRPLSDWIPPHGARLGARVLSDALALYHRALRQIYGDFQPGNVLWGEEGGFALLDMTIPNPFYWNPAFAALESGLASADLGYWLFSVCTRTWRFAIRNPVHAWRLLMLSRHLVEEHGRHTGVSPGALRRDVQFVARAHLKRLASKSLKGRLIAGLGALVAALVLARLRPAAATEEA